ncbi:catalase family peroxidase [Zavarzinia sp. CC-PAN008]|uniref:catalase family peroxidase n=1 Tax=Zavarzinia sp. CC-PAN008 TaxID=3243332 RepID=UPI003F742443
MADRNTYSLSSLLSGRALPRLAAIAVLLGGVTAAWAAAGGWFSPEALTPAGVVDALEGTTGRHDGFRRAHAKGVCIAGTFESSGNAARLSKASLFQGGSVVPVFGRLSLAGPVPDIADGPDATHSMALNFALPNGEAWRTAMVAIPVFPFATPEDFHAQLLANQPDPATGKPDPAKFIAFVMSHPKTAAAFAVLQGHVPASGFDNATYHALNAFRFVDAQGVASAVRWTMMPVEPFAPVIANPPADRNYLFDAFAERLRKGPLQWHLVVTVAQAGDPTNDATQAWPEDREKVDAGTLTIREIVGEAQGGPCRDINFDPLILPAGIQPSDDPILSARSAAYSHSFNRREGEAKPASTVQVQAEAPAAPAGAN